MYKLKPKKINTFDRYILASSHSPKKIHVRLIYSKLTLCVSVSMHGCLSLCGPVMDGEPVQGLPYLSPDCCLDRLQPTCNPEQDEVDTWVNKIKLNEFRLCESKQTVIILEQN